MKRNILLQPRYLSLSIGALVASALLPQTALADTKTAEKKVHELPTIEIAVKQGSKNKTDVVTLDTKDESTETDLRGLLKTEPSITFSGGNGTSQYIAIRGMGQNSVDVKVDNAYSDSQILYHQGRHQLDPSLVKIVAVQKGAGSASAGIGQTNGAIVAKTVDALDLLEGLDKDWGVKLNAGYSSNKEHSYGVTGFGKLGGFDYLLSYNMTDQDNYKAGKKYAVITTGGATDRVGTYRSPVDGSNKVYYQALDKESYLAKLGYTFGDHRVVLSHFNTTNKGTRNIREEFDWFDRNDPQYREISFQNTNLEYKGKLGVLGTADANVYLMKQERYSSNDRNNGYANRVATANDTTVNTFGVNFGLDKQITKDTLIKYGINYRHQDIDPNAALAANRVKTEKKDSGVYAELIGNIGDFTLTGGMRYDHFDYTSVTGKKISDGALNPSIGLIWQATPALSFNVVHNYATRSPRLVDALRTSSSSTDIADGTKAEQAKNTEIGLNFTHENFSIDAGYFWQEIDNLLQAGQITRHDEASGSTAIIPGISNVGFAKNKGFEINTRYKWNGLTAHLGVAKSDPKYYSGFDARNNAIRFDNREFGSTVGRTYTAGLAYRFANPNLEVGVNHRRVDKVRGQSAYQRHITGDRGNYLTMIKHGYDVTDLYANYKPLSNDRLNVNFAVNNVTDEYYVPHTAIGGVPGVGREFRVGFNYKF